MESKESNFQEKYPSILGISIIILVIGSYFSYSVLIAYDIPLSDHWDWIRKLLIPYTVGEISFIEYSSGAFLAFSHSHILTLLFSLLNYSIFDLRYDLDCYVGAISTALLYIFLMKKYVQSMAGLIDDRYLIVIACALTVIFLNPFNINIIPLIQFEFLYLLIAIVYLSLYDGMLKNKVSPIVFCVCTFIVFIIGDAMGTVGIMTAVVHILLVSPMKNKLKYLSGVVIAVVLGYLIGKYFSTYVGTVRISKVDAIAYVLGNKLDSIKFIVYGYSQGLIDSHSVISRIFGPGSKGVTLVIGLVMLAINLSAFYLYYTRRSFFSSALPALLIIYSAIIVGGILLSRFPLEGPLYSLNDRYQRLAVLGVFGSYWIFTLVIFGGIGPKTRIKENRYSGALLVALTAFILLNGMVSHAVKWRSVYNNELEKLNEMARAVETYSRDPNVDIGAYVTDRHCGDHICKPTIRFLKENKLSIFRASHVIHKK